MSPKVFASSSVKKKAPVCRGWGGRRLLAFAAEQTTNEASHEVFLVYERLVTYRNLIINL